MAKKSGGLPTVTAMDVDYQAEDDMRTIQRAEEIRKDPQRMTSARKKAAEQIKALSCLTGPKMSAAPKPKTSKGSGGSGRAKPWSSQNRPGSPRARGSADAHAD